MDVNEIQQRILKDDSFVLSETEKLQYFYRLKDEIRYNKKRDEEFRTESVAEHIYGMHIISTYFLTLEDPDHTWNHEKIMNLITWHDIDEIETGDILGHKKTDKDRANGAVAAKQVIAKAPICMQDKLDSLLDTYSDQTSPEAKFVKAIDKVEPLFECFTENGKTILQSLETTYDMHCRTKYPYIEDFKYIKRFCDVITTEMWNQGYLLP